MHILHGKEPVSLKFHKRPGLFVIFLFIGQGDPCSFCRQRTVNINRHIRDFPFLCQLLEIIQQYLGTPHRKRRDNYITAPFYGFIDDSRQFFFFVIGFMFPVPVGGFRNNEIRARQDGRIFHDRLFRLSHVAGKDHRRLFPILFNDQIHGSAAQDMAGHPELCRHARNHLKGLLKIVHVKMLQCNIGIVYGKQGFHLGFPRPQALTVGKLRIGFLDMGAVRQQDRAQLLCGFCAVNAAFKAFLYQPGNQSAVVHMGMGKHHRVDFRRVKGKRFFIKCFDGFRALKHAAVHQHLLPVDFQ